MRASLERLLTRQGDFAWATFVYRELLRRDSEDAEARYNLGRALKQKDTAGAIERFREAVRLAPKYPEAHYQLALALAAAGAREEARAQFEEAHRLAPHLKPPEAPQ